MSNSDNSKEFPTEDVLSACIGILVSEKGIGSVYEVLNYMSGESLYTHQLPRVGREAMKVLLKHYPELAASNAEKEAVNTSNWKEYRAKWIKRHGKTMVVPLMSADDHESIEPISELAETVHPDRIHIVKTSP